jgi:hypothetical protein
MCTKPGYQVTTSHNLLHRDDVNCRTLIVGRARNIIKLRVWMRPSKGREPFDIGKSLWNMGLSQMDRKIENEAHLGNLKP